MRAAFFLASAALLAAERVEEHRPVFRYSIVPGGVYSRVELESARAADPLVEAHYRPVEAEFLQPVTLRRDRLGYISYRYDGRIFWTRHPVRIRAGETLLCDGRRRIRARSGSLVSDRPMSPIRLADPPAAAFSQTVTSDSPQLSARESR
ncbi:MAG: hypothetical protein R2729_13395 [Bryobacteraceae bacterium]